MSRASRLGWDSDPPYHNVILNDSSKNTNMLIMAELDKQHNNNIDLDLILRLMMEPDCNAHASFKSSTILNEILILYKGKVDESYGRREYNDDIAISKILEILRVVLGRTEKAHVERLDSNGLCTVHHIAFMGSVQVLRLFLEWAIRQRVNMDIETGNRFQTCNAPVTPLFLAVYNRNGSMQGVRVKLWLEAGANPNFQSRNGNFTPFYMIAKYYTEYSEDRLAMDILGECVNVYKNLIEKGADPNIQCGQYGNTPLHAAAQYRCHRNDINLEYLWLTYLLDMGKGNVNCMNNRGETPFSLAIYADDIRNAMTKYANANGIRIFYA